MEIGDILSAIGRTPIIELKRLKPRSGARILIKLEYLNPTGSHKDRIALYMVRDAIEKHGLRPGDIVVEASSGNTGISIAFVARRLGLKPVIVVPRSTSRIKIAIMKLLGAEVVVGDEDPESPNYYRNLAKEIAKERGGIYLDQYSNPANARAHYETTAREIWEALNGRIDVFVMGVGTGGTITGVGRFLKERKKNVMIVAVTPRGSPLAGGVKGDRIEGLMSSSIPPLLDRSIIDRVIEVSYVEAVEMAKKLIREEGVLAGISTGANVVAALRIGEELSRDSVVVTIAADSAYRYPELLDLENA